MRSWRPVVLVAGLLLLLGGLFRPLESLPVQTAVHPVPEQQVLAGERLFNYGLIGHGLLLLALAVAWPRRGVATAPHTAGEAESAEAAEPLYPWKHFPETENGLTSGWVLLLVIGVGLVLRIIGLNTCLWYDEVVTLTEFARLPFPELIRNYADQNQHPLYSLAAHSTLTAFGESAWALRLPAVLFGLASLWVFYDFARRLAPWPEPLLATILLTVSYHHVWFSQNARGYTALLFWAILGSSLFIQNLCQPRLSRTLAYALVTALALYTHLTAVFVIAAHGLIYLALLARKVWHGRPATRDWLPLAGFALAGTLTLQLYALILPQVFGTFHGQAGGIRVRAWTDLSWGAGQVLQGLVSGFSGMLGASCAALVVGVGFLSYLRRNPLVVALLVLPCVLGLGVMLLLNRHLYPRFFFTVFAFGALVVIRGALVVGGSVAALVVQPEFKSRWQRYGGWSLASLVICLSALSLAVCYRHPKQDYTAALAYVHQVRHPDDPVVTVGMAVIPITRFYGKEVEPAASAGDLEAIRARRPDRPTWLIYTFRDHMESFHPDILQIIDQAFVCDRVFPGTVGGGAILVCRSTSGHAALAAR